MTDGTPPVTLLGRRQIGENRVWRIHADHVQGDNGAEVDDFLVIEPKGRRADFVSGVSVLPVLADGKIALLRTYRHAVERFCWEVPRGFVDDAEDPAQSALRELAEEAGLVCPPSRLIPLGHMTPESSTIAGRIAFFVALDCHAAGTRDLSEVGLGERHDMDPEAVRRMLIDGEIEDASSALALHGYFARKS